MQNIKDISFEILQIKTVKIPEYENIENKFYQFFVQNFFALKGNSTFKKFFLISKASIIR